ncbi:hypothetical protein ACI797_09605 [Geodermatophilus sp. SYSU D00691]
MLPLTPTPLQTAGERALFAELARWDTGGAVRAAVVASLPFGDGALGRRLSDAVLLVPEGLAVVRIAEVPKQSGVVTARPDGAWTIGPGAGPGDVLHLGGGGSTPLDGLMRAGMEAAMRLRRAGLEPGRIARLTVLVGELGGLVPEDGDLGEGDQVALLEPRSLLLGIARASRYSGVDNPRLWTTADVRAALEALGLEGRGPTVEELNGEGFPYSPYVLRRPELLAPAAMTAGSTAPPPVHPAEAAEAPPSPVAAAVAAQAAARAAVAPVAPPPVQPAPPPVVPRPAPAADPFAGVPARDTIAVGAPPEPPVDETGGIGGLFAGAEPDEPPPPAPALPPVPPPTAVQQVPAQPQVPAAVPPRTAVHTAPVQAPPPPVPPSSAAAARSRRTALLIGAAVLVVALLALGGVLLLGGGGDDPGGGPAAAGSSTPAARTTPAGPEPGATQQVGGVTFTLEAVQVTDTCLGHGYGDVGDSFATTDCVGLSRGLYSASLEGRPIVVAVSHVRMPDSAAARELRALADTTGTGNVSDLLRDGVTYDGAPAELADAEYASAVSGAVVTIVETAWAAPEAADDAGGLDAAASSGLVLELPDPPTA